MMKSCESVAALALLWLTVVLDFTKLVTCSEDPTLIRLHKGWVFGNRHSVLGGTIGRYSSYNSAC